MKTLEHTPIILNDRNAIAEAVDQLRKQFPVEHAILFGSKARGDDDEYSDIDLLLITSYKLPWKDKRAISDLLFDVGMKYDVMFSFLCVPRGEWNGGIFTAFPIYKEILREGASVL
jgi:predicted nucleotidyltransferase